MGKGLQAEGPRHHEARGHRSRVAADELRVLGRFRSDHRSPGRSNVSISTVVKDKNGEKSTETRYRVSGETPPIRTAAEDDADDEDDDEPAPVKPKAKAKPPVEEEEDDEDEEEETEEEDEEEEEDEPPPPPVKKKKTAVKK